jgi:hypothetical protein
MYEIKLHEVHLILWIGGYNGFFLSRSKSDLIGSDNKSVRKSTGGVRFSFTAWVWLEGMFGMGGLVSMVAIAVLGFGLRVGLGVRSELGAQVGLVGVDAGAEVG